MQTATLGGLIKDYRLRKRLSQLDVSLRIGWSDTTRLSKIEQGRVGKPTLETVEKIIKALDLNEQEKGEFLLAGGYLPTDREIENVVKQFKDRIDSWRHPAYILDFSWRIHYVNERNFRVYKVSPELRKKIYNLNLLELPFLAREQMPTDIQKGSGIEDKLNFATALVAQFKVELNGRESERWYKDLVKKLMKYEEFRRLWPKINKEDSPKLLWDYEFKIIDWPEEKKTLKYHLFASRLISDPRFYLIFYLPADEVTEEYDRSQE